MCDPKTLIDQSKYPVLESGPARDTIVEHVRASLAEDGCAVLKGFITPDGVQTLLAQAEGVSDKGFKSTARTNVYFTKDDPSLPSDDPRRQFYDRSNYFIPADNFATGSPLRDLYTLPALSKFVQDCLQEENFFPYADPLADVIINAADAGNGFPWHFDTNNFTVTLAIQNAEHGGEFEYAPNIRKGSENFEEVTKVLSGTSDQIRTLVLEPGDLQLFRGRYSLHRVAPLAGTIPRYVAIFSYVEEPDMVATPERCKQLYGRCLPVHYERAGQRADTFLD